VNAQYDVKLIVPPRVEGAVAVAPGRRLGFAEFGPAHGRAVVWLHGTPGARRQIPQNARTIATDLDIRLLGIDRPGVGWSTPHLYESILGFAADLEIALDRLAVEDLLIIGLSGGGPYALACAYAMPDRIRAVGVLGGVAPTRGPDAVPGGLVGALNRLAPVLPPLRAPLAVGLTCLVRSVRPFAGRALEAYAAMSPEEDRAVLSRPEMRAMFLDDIIGNGRHGMGAPVDDLILFTRHWGFALPDINTPVRWWHGASDSIVPLAHGAHVVKRLGDASLVVRPGESHLGGFDASEEVLGTLFSLWDRATPTKTGWS
jgi:pimeloyl-ACP methyl ester carboxylesterase